MSIAVLKIKSGIVFLKEHKKDFFWYWIGYQCLKGTLTTSLIWAPMLIAYFH